jgi:HEAT repeat protein
MFSTLVVAGFLLIVGSGALVLATCFRGSEDASKNALRTTDSADLVGGKDEASRTEVAAEAPDRRGLAKPSDSRPSLVVRTGPSPGELVGWSRSSPGANPPSTATSTNKIARTRPDAVGRANPPAGERVGWGKGGQEASIPRFSEVQLLEELARAPTVGLGGSARGVLKSWSSSIKGSFGMGGDGRVIDASPVLSVRPDLAMLPMRSGASCQLPTRAAANLAMLSRKLNAYIDGLAPKKLDGTRISSKNLEQVLREEKRGKRPEWVRVEAVPAMLQILVHEEKPLRRLLVDLLTQIKEPRSTVALVRRALFDLDPDIRAAARSALKGRNPDDFRPVLLKALRYPWAPAAWHAAEALVSLGDQQVIPNLVTMLDQPDPAGLQPVNNRFIYQDLVKIRHTRNCLLCHAPSAKGEDVCMKVDPWVKNRTTLTAKQATSLISKGQLSVDALSGYGGSSGLAALANAQRSGGCVTAESDLNIRFDVTFLRQDFSIQLPIAGPGTNQRFDYVVRTRVYSRKEAERLSAGVTPRETYPQRSAVLFALRRLTGQDAGTTAVAWKKLYPDAEIEVESVRLVQKMMKANPLELPLLLKHYGESKGEAYTRALEVGVARLSGSSREAARGALAKRLSEMGLAAVRKRLIDNLPGVRQAAVIACEKKKENDTVPDLIERLSDSDAETARLARSALKVITGKDLESAEAWRSWWKDGVALRE